MIDTRPQHVSPQDDDVPARCALLHEALAIRVSATAEETAQRAVEKTLRMIGIEIDDPLKAQKDFVVMREVGKLAMDPEFRKDIENVRVWRKRVETIGNKSMMVVVGAAMLAALGWLANGFRGSLH